MRKILILHAGALAVATAALLSLAAPTVQAQTSQISFTVRNGKSESTVRVASPQGPPAPIVDTDCPATQSPVSTWIGRNSSSGHLNYNACIDANGIITTTGTPANDCPTASKGFILQTDPSTGDCVATQLHVFPVGAPVMGNNCGSQYTVLFPASGSSIEESCISSNLFAVRDGVTHNLLAGFGGDISLFDPVVPNKLCVHITNGGDVVLGSTDITDVTCNQPFLEFVTPSGAQAGGIRGLASIGFTDQTQNTYETSASITLTSAQLLSLSGGATEVQIIPSPGAGQVVAVGQIYFNYIFGTTPYVIGDPSDAFVCGFSGTLAIPPFGGVGLQNFIDGATGAIGSGILGESSVPTSVAANNGIGCAIQGPTPTLTGGDGTLRITVWYLVASVQ